MLSIPHLIIIFLVALVVLGPEKLPQVARVMGKAMADFRRITNEFRVQVEDEMRDIERHTREREISTAAATAPPVLPPFESTEVHSESAPTASTPAESIPAVSVPEESVPAEGAPTEKPADGEPHPA